MAAVDTAIAGLDDAEKESADSDSSTWRFVRPDDPTQPEGESTAFDFSIIRRDLGLTPR